jgi:hypothetical protein
MASVEDVLTASQALIDAKSAFFTALAALNAKNTEVLESIPTEVAALATANSALESAAEAARIQLGYAAVESAFNDANTALQAAKSELSLLAPDVDPGV